MSNTVTNWSPDPMPKFWKRVQLLSDRKTRQAEKPLQQNSSVSSQLNWWSPPPSCPTSPTSPFRHGFISFDENCSTSVYGLKFTPQNSNTYLVWKCCIHLAYRWSCRHSILSALVKPRKKLPPAYGVGKFMASMSLFKTEFYEETYQSNPELTTADYLNVGM